MSLTSLFCVFCCISQASGAIYQSTYASLTCSGTPTITIKLASTTCVATANGPQSNNVYVTAAMVASAGATYEIDSFSASCGSSPLFINAYLNPSCTNSGTCSSSTGAFSAVTTVCPSSGTGSGSGTVVSGPGSVTTGYAVQSISYAASDTQCTGQSFTSASFYVLGICVANSGSTAGNMFTSDVRCVFISSSSPMYLCVADVVVVVVYVLLLSTGIGCYLPVCVCVIDL